MSRTIEPSEFRARSTSAVWRILVVDDEVAFHRSIEFSLKDVRIEGVPLDVHYASTTDEAYALLEQYGDGYFALAMIDVIMHKQHDGLELVAKIRNQLHIYNTRLVICTGHAGYAPPLAVVTSLDINDYRSKSNLNREEVICIVYTAIRAFKLLERMANHIWSLQHASSAISSVGFSGGTLAVAREGGEQLLSSVNSLTCVKIQIRRGETGRTTLADVHRDYTQIDQCSNRLEETADEALRLRKTIEGKATSSFFSESTDYQIVLTAYGENLDGLDRGVCRAFASSFFAAYWAAHVSEFARNQEKLAAVGSFAAGIAHEVNNSLSVVLSSVEQLELRLAQSVASVAGSSDAIGLVKAAVSQISSIVNGTLSYARGDCPPATNFAITRALDAAFLATKERIQAVATLEVEIQPNDNDCMSTNSIETSVIQIVTNILANAADAFDNYAPENRVKVRAEAVDSGIRIAIADNGRGIPTENHNRIFEPFFSTKPKSGTGLGLAICRALSSQCGGRLELATTDDGHTRFELTLPSVQLAPQAKGAADALNILLIEDDRSIATNIQGALSKHCVKHVEDGAQGLDYLRENPNVDILWVDYHLRESTAREFLRSVVDFHPHLLSRTTLITGAHHSPSVAELSRELGIRILAKPFSTSQLLGCIDQAFLNQV